MQGDRFYPNVETTWCPRGLVCRNSTYHTPQHDLDCAECGINFSMPNPYTVFTSTRYIVPPCFSSWETEAPLPRVHTNVNRQQPTGCKHCTDLRVGPQGKSNCGVTSVSLTDRSEEAPPVCHLMKAMGT